MMGMVGMVKERRGGRTGVERRNEAGGMGDEWGSGCQMNEKNARLLCCYRGRAEGRIVMGHTHTDTTNTCRTVYRHILDTHRHY